MDDLQTVGAHSVLVLTADGRVLASHSPVPATALGSLVMRLRAEHVGARILIDSASAVSTITAFPAATTPPISSSNDLQAVAELSHHMLWATFDRAASAQAWMLQQANVFTSDLLENNRKLADQASALQTRFQDAMQRIDLMKTEKKLMEYDLMARRLERQLQAEVAGPGREPDPASIAELICGVSSFLAARHSRGSGDQN